MEEASTEDIKSSFGNIQRHRKARQTQGRDYVTESGAGKGWEV